MDQGVVPFAERDEVPELGLASVGPEDDVVDIRAAGLAAGETAPVPIALAYGTAQLGRRLTSAIPDGDDLAIGVMDHEGDRGVAADHVECGETDSGPILDVAAPPVRRVPDRPVGLRPSRTPRLRFRGNAARGLRAG